MKKYTFFIGTDVSRNKLDHAVMSGKTLLFHKEIPNNAVSITEFVTELKQLPKFTITKAVFCMEHTGIYCNPLIETLRKARANMVIENAMQIKNSLGTIRGKYDKIDAIRIAEYAYRSRENLRLYVHKRLIVQQLAHLNSLRNRLSLLQQKLKTPLKEQQDFIKETLVKQNVNLCSRSLEAIRQDIEEVELTIAKLIDSDRNLQRLMKLITSVHCIGPVTALHIILTTNEFRDIHDPKKFACYSGVAPFARESGAIKTKARVSHFANKKMKALLHFCALNAKVRVPELKAFYDRKTNIQGKSKMSVINAIRYKLILRIFACVNQNRCYSKNLVNNTNTLQTETVAHLQESRSEAIILTMKNTEIKFYRLKTIGILDDDNIVLKFHLKDEVWDISEDLLKVTICALNIVEHFIESLNNLIDSLIHIRENGNNLEVLLVKDSESYSTIMKIPYQSYESEIIAKTASDWKHQYLSLRNEYYILGGTQGKVSI